MTPDTKLMLSLDPRGLTQLTKITRGGAGSCFVTSVNNASSLSLKSRRQNDPFSIGALAEQRVKVE